ncbi:hypothetical protein BpHYR1_009488 [Brachionus plicatilis]|uniref:Uncharacterized protein n=1 Tax=Brachionus plicatilis TaxID=10195 RepID=A0A3M7RZY8_BRAPC|nr:hypothetical protein BpHYR1_009488 [Brachionus plicatilis]
MYNLDSKLKIEIKIERSKYKLTIMGLPRTNNKLEGWHNGLQSTIKSHPDLLSLIHLAQKVGINLFNQNKNRIQSTLVNPDKFIFLNFVGISDYQRYRYLGK